MASSGNSSMHLTSLSFSEIFITSVTQLNEYKNNHGDLNVLCKYDQFPDHEFALWHCLEEGAMETASRGTAISLTSWTHIIKLNNQIYLNY